MLDAKKQKHIDGLLEKIEEVSMQGSEREIKKCMEQFNVYLDKLSEKEREYAFSESIPVFRKIMKKVDEQKNAIDDMIKDAGNKNEANKAYAKY